MKKEVICKLKYDLKALKEIELNQQNKSCELSESNMLKYITYVQKHVDVKKLYFHINCNLKVT